MVGYSQVTDELNHFCCCLSPISGTNTSPTDGVVWLGLAWPLPADVALMTMAAEVVAITGVKVISWDETKSTWTSYL